MKKWMIGAVALMATTITMAQPPAAGKMGGKHPMHQMGKHHGRQHHRGMPFAKLNLTDAQKEQMKAINADFKSQMQTLMSKENITVKEQRDQREALSKSHKAKIEGILTADQKSQLVQIKADAKKRADQMGAKRLERMKEKLDLTDAQVASIKANQEASKSKMEAIWKNEQLDRETKKQQMMAIRKDMKENLDEVLTAEQKAKWEEMRKEQHDKTQHFKERREKEAVK